MLQQLTFLFFRKRHPDLSNQLDEFRHHLIAGAREMPELKAWQLQGECVAIITASLTRADRPWSASQPASGGQFWSVCSTEVKRVVTESTHIGQVSGRDWEVHT